MKKNISFNSVLLYIFLLLCLLSVASAGWRYIFLKDFEIIDDVSEELETDL